MARLLHKQVHMTTNATFRFKVFATASLLASSILIVVLVAQRPDLSGSTGVESGNAVAHSQR